jgi:hypothetical protein
MWKFFSTLDRQKEHITVTKVVSPENINQNENSKPIYHIFTRNLFIGIL